MKKTKNRIHTILEEKYEVYILVGQQVEFGETDLFVYGHSMSLVNILINMCDEYPPLIGMIKEAIKNIDEKNKDI